jgi:hypothetical protein
MGNGVIGQELHDIPHELSSHICPNGFINRLEESKDVVARRCVDVKDPRPFCNASREQEVSSNNVHACRHLGLV